MQKRMILLFLAIILPATVLASGINVTKTVSEQGSFGSQITVRITLTSLQSTDADVTVTEIAGSAQPIDPAPFPAQATGDFGFMPAYYQWQVRLPAHGTAIVSYTIKPGNVGYYLFGKTKVTADDGGIYYSNLASTLVNCKPSDSCDASIGEDYTNCPSNCPPPRIPGKKDASPTETTTGIPSPARTPIPAQATLSIQNPVNAGETAIASPRPQAISIPREWSAWAVGLILFLLVLIALVTAYGVTKSKKRK